MPLYDPIFDLSFKSYPSQGICLEGVFARRGHGDVWKECGRPECVDDISKAYRRI